MKHHGNDGRGPRRVFLNGEEVTQVLECDDELGYVIRHTGGVETMGREWATERLEGDVRVEPM